MKYIEFINDLIKKKVQATENVVLFGQNVSAGSCIGGLTKGLKPGKGGIVINTPNVENTLCGVGFGLMMQGVPSIFFMKQQDFLLLGIDHLANTYNFIRRKNPASSFTIFPVIVDNGYQGLQSSLNNFADFCSIARIPGYAVTNKVDAENIINSHLVSPGFRIIGISQRLFGEQILEPENIYINEDKTVFQYSEGRDAVIACFNLSFPYGYELEKKAKEKGLNTSLFSVNSMTPVDWKKIIEEAKRSKKIVIIDDSKTENAPYYALLNDISDACDLEKKIIIRRDMSKDWLSPNADRLEMDYEKILNELS